MVQKLTHPIAKTLINRMRDKNTDAVQFRSCIAELSKILLLEAFKEIEMETKSIQTWQGTHDFEFINDKSIMFIPIMRAGMPMLDSLITLFPDAISGFLAMKRDEMTHKAVLYYDRVPDCEGKTVVLLDPMVATGGSLCDALDVIKAKGPKRILSLNLIGAPEGLSVVEERHPDVPVYIAQIDLHLNDNKFIIPGIGDAGDRAYNTPE
ncbi:uracil phosphoribosyltransferase [Sulfurimonas sp. C5]|uniref:uracil phosphoribosyltransferase n=1 Tax=Sulfurimonas sp. C5 TaxID=3036947 RepID=UPI002457EA56|nr:uracil phosphoribosyltransferase [Sulfurimonas sp. C5]MDH4943932.1 uracil phosphoribosyltransferase [Sulfurimonas sp. C5]